MDIEQYRKNVESRLKGSILKKQIKSEIEQYEEQKLGVYETSKLKYMPLIENAQEVKSAYNKKQDELIKQLGKNRLTPIETNHNVVGELEAAPIKKEPNYIKIDFKSKYWAANKEFLQKYDLEPLLVLFQKGVEYKRTNKKTFDGYLTSLKIDRKLLANKNKKVKKSPHETAIRKEYYFGIDRVIDALQMIEINQAGTGIRRYKQPKRNAYKIYNSKYGGLVINMPKLLNEMIIEAKQGGKIIYQDNVDKSLVELLTKRYSPKKKYSSKSIEIFNNLNMLANIDKHKSSGKSKLVGGNIYYTNPDELFKKLQLITGSRRSGNSNIRLKNEAYQIIDKLLELNVISKWQYDKYVQQHLV